MTSTIQFSIYRFQPDKQSKPFMQKYALEVDPGQDMMVLEALTRLSAEDETLAFRRSCGEGVCGSDGMNINGRNQLACITPLSSLKTPIIIRPLPGLPVIRDLIVDLTTFYEQYAKVKPWLMSDSDRPDNKESLQSPEAREKLDGLYECILCACCSTACPSWWWNPDKFLGPAPLLALGYRLADTREPESKKRERLEGVGDENSVFRCKTIMNCTSVCPKGLNPAKAIGEIKRQLLREEV